jgi:hypothetical protein
MQDLIELEEQGWRALSTGGDAAKEFYDSLLTDDAIDFQKFNFQPVGLKKFPRG